jgi:hypothetical protein
MIAEMLLIGLFFSVLLKITRENNTLFTWNEKIQRKKFGKYREGIDVVPVYIRIWFKKPLNCPLCLTWWACLLYLLIFSTCVRDFLINLPVAITIAYISGTGFATNIIDLMCDIVILLLNKISKWERE